MKTCTPLVWGALLIVQALGFGGAGAQQYPARPIRISALIAAELARYARIVKDAGVRID